MGLICAQEDYVARTGETLSDAFLPIKTSDGLVVEYRKWLDRVGHGMPFFQGWKKSKVRVVVLLLFGSCLRACGQEENRARGCGTGGRIGAKQAVNGDNARSHPKPV